jgi:hypothetical protein
MSRPAGVLSVWLLLGFLLSGWAIAQQTTDANYDTAEQPQALSGRVYPRPANLVCQLVFLARDGLDIGAG